MTAVRQMLGDYLALRRGLGYKLLSAGTALQSFVGFLEKSGAEYISTEHAVAWALLPTSVQAVRWWRRLAFVRGFARYCVAFDPRTEVPPADLLPYRYERRAPYFFSDDEIRALLQTAIALPAKDGWANHTHYYLIGLLSVTGIRISEALNLTMDDVDLDNAVLAIHSTKFGKSRLVPLHQSTVKALADYRERRARFLKGRQVPYWFVNRQGKQVRCDTFDRQFRRLTDELGLVAANGQRPPHLHDLRHRFAMSTLLRWYSDGQDIDRRLPILSAYLGHVDIHCTYWYLSAFPPLLAAARDKLEKHWEVVP